jgi:hypothetical protein
LALNTVTSNLVLDCRELGDVLTNNYPTLESLKVAVKFDSLTGFDLTRAKENWRILHTLIFPPSCTMLRTLEFAPELILGWEEEQSDELSTILPESLKCLHFKGYFVTWDLSPWIFDPIYEKIMNYIDSFRGVILKELSMSRFKGLVPFVGAELETIKARCNDLGVRFQCNAIVG